MKILSSGSFRGSRSYNGDIIGEQNNMFFVCDGATALFDDFRFFNTGDVFEYMQLLKRNIKNNGIIEDIFKNAIKMSNINLVGMNNYEEYELPNFTIAAVREIGEDIEYYILCDTLISILYKDGHVETIQDERINPIKEISRQNIKEILERKDITDLEKRRLILKNEQDIRKLANQENGYPVGSVKEESIDAGYHGTRDKSSISRILLCSDGFYDSIAKLPSTKEEFDVQYINQRIDNILKKEKRDDISYILLEI